MNKLLNKMERKLGKFAISNLSLYIIIAYILGYILSFTGALNIFTLDPYEICHGQVWRILTWIIVPPSKFDLFTVIMLYFYYQLGTTLERTWGAFRYNIYIFSGMIFTILGAFLLYAISTLNGGDPQTMGYIVSTGFSTYYINLSIFLAFASVYPNMQVLLFFVIPVKIKWMAYLDIALLGYQFIFSGAADRIAIVMSLLNFIVFFFTTRNYNRINPKEIHRRQSFKRATKQGDKVFSSTFTSNENISKHKCAICNRTEKDSDTLEFRFCSKCNGNYEYCSDHLFTHTHVQ